MEKMPYHPQLESVLPTVSATVPAPVALDWRSGLPSLTGALVSLRELRLSDAPSLFAALTGVEVSRFISPPPHSVEGFEKFIAWTHRQREAGQYICFAVMPKGSASAIGLFQVRAGIWHCGMGLRDRERVLGHRDIPRRCATGPRFRVRRHRRAPYGGPLHAQEQQGQRRTSETGRRAGGDTASILAPRRRIPRPVAVDHHRRRSARGESRLGRSRHPLKPFYTSP